MNRLLPFSAASLLALTSLHVGAQMSAADLKSANSQSAQASRDAALAALADLKATDHKHAIDLFTLPENKRSLATVGAGVPVYFIGLDKVKAYRPGGDPLKLLSAPMKVIYSVRVDNTAVSTIEVSKRPERSAWAVSSVAGPSFGQTVLDVNAKIAAARDSASNLLLWIPAMDLWFFGQLLDEKLTLLPLSDEPALNFKKGVAVDAARAFTVLQPAAMKVETDGPR